MIKLWVDKVHKLVRKAQNYLHKNYQCLTQYPDLFIMRKLARFELIRKLFPYIPGLTKPVSQFASTSSSLFPNLNVEDVVQSLKKEGCHLGIQLPDEIVQELLDFSSIHQCYGDRDPNHPFILDQKSEIEAKSGKEFTLGSYLDSHISCPAFQRIKNDPVLLEIAHQYLQRPPVYLTSELCWSFPNSESSYAQRLRDAQVFHYDIDDYRSIKFFFYLTDVDELSGPHVCLLKSHYNKRFWHQIMGQHCASIPEDKLIDMYGAKNVFSIQGQQGFGFVEDTFCFHKGTLPLQKNRLMLQCEFTTNYYPAPRAYM